MSASSCGPLIRCTITIETDSAANTRTVSRVIIPLAHGGEVGLKMRLGVIYMKKTLTTVAFLTALATGCITYQRANFPPVVNTNNGLLIQTYNVHSPISEEEVEKRLVYLARYSPVEEAWIYDRKNKELIECGNFETVGGGVAVVNLSYYFTMKSDNYVVYHIHPLSSTIHQYFYGDYDNAPKDAMERAQCIERIINSADFILAMPGSVDLQHIYAKREDGLEYRIVDWRGVASVKIDTSKFSGDSPDVGEVWNDCNKPNVSHPDTIKKSAEKGIIISYRRIAPASLTIDETQARGLQGLLSAVQESRWEERHRDNPLLKHKEGLPNIPIEELPRIHYITRDEIDDSWLNPPPLLIPPPPTNITK